MEPFKLQFLRLLQDQYEKRKNIRGQSTCLLKIGDTCLQVVEGDLLKSLDGLTILPVLSKCHKKPGFLHC